MAQFGSESTEPFDDLCGIIVDINPPHMSYLVCGLGKEIPARMIGGSKN